MSPASCKYRIPVILSLPWPFGPTIQEMTTGSRPVIAIGIAIAIDGPRTNPVIR